MKLIYLDTSHFDVLCREMEKRPKRFREFMSAWNENDYVLALTKVHVEEIIALSRPESVDLRFALLERFVPFRYESENFFEREVLIELWQKGLVLPAVGHNPSQTKMFFEGVESREQLLDMKAAYNILRALPFHSMMNKANRLSWQAAADAKRSKGKEPRTSDIRDRTFGKLFFRFTRLFGLDEPRQRTRGVRLSQFLRTFSFRLKVKFAIRNKLGIKVLDNSRSRAALEGLSVNDCKGLWLRAEVEERLKLSGDFSPNNERDLDHVQYYPYVDVFLSDKRIIDKLGQVSKEYKSVLWLQDSRKLQRTSNTLESMMSALFGYSGTE